MTQKEKLSLIEETLDVEQGSLTPETFLSEIEQYDSMTKLSLIVVFDDEFGKRLTGEMIRSFNTIGDILNAMD